MSSRGKAWLAVSLAAALVALFPLSLRWQAQWHLSAYRKKLIAAGEKLTVEELAPKRNWPATNTALFLRLASTIQDFWQYYPTAMLSLKPGVARVVWREARLMESVDVRKPAIDIWPALMASVRTNGQTLEEIQKLVDAGGIEFIEDYSQQDLNGYFYLSEAKTVAGALNARAMLALHQGQMQEAEQYLKCCGTVSQFAAKVPLEIDQLVSYACLAIAVGGCWEALQARGWTDAQLAELQRQWDQLSFLAAAESSLAMERARGPMEFQAARTSRQGLAEMLGPDSGLRTAPEIWHDSLLHFSTGARELLTSYPGYWGWRWIWSYRDEQRYLAFMTTMIKTTREAQERRSILAALKDRSENEFFFPSGTSSFDVVGSIAGGTEQSVEMALRAQTEANMVSTAIALERYRLAHHAYPAALAEMAPAFLRAVPVDCMDGHDLRYRRNPDGSYLLCSVGEDGIDNGGDPTPREGKKPGFLNGRDWVWPRAATAEEVKAYESSLSALGTTPKTGVNK